MRRTGAVRRIGLAVMLSGVLGMTGCQNPLIFTGTGIHGSPLEGTGTETTVEVLPENRQLEKLSTHGHVLIVEEGEERAIEVVLTPDTASLYRLTYESEDPTVCTVRQDGVVSGISEGETQIKIQDSISGLRTEIKIQVKTEILPTELQVSQTEVALGIGEQAGIEVTVLPEDAEDQELLWSSSDEKIATVDETGVITAVSAGTCIVTVQAHADETIKAEITVTVSETKQNGNGSGGGSAGNSGSAGPSGSTGGSSSGSSTGSGSSGGGSSSGGSTASAYYMDSYAEQVLSLVNAERANAGLAPLSMNYTLVSASKVRAAEITQSFSHTRPNGSSCFTAYDEAGVSYWGAGENIAAGQWSPESVMNSWMNSPGHRANILDGSFTQIGIACYYDPNSSYGYYWVQNFIY